MSSWSVILMLEYEYDQGKGKGADTIQVRRVIDGVSPANDDALWAANEALLLTRRQYNLDERSAIQVTGLDVMDVDDR